MYKPQKNPSAFTWSYKSCLLRLTSYNTLT